MGYQPQKGVRPPQLEGRRTGRPKGSRNNADFWADVFWGYEHRGQDRAQPPTIGALWWWRLGVKFPDELEVFLQAWGKI